MKLKNGKAAGADNIPAEALKVDIDTTVEMLYPLFARIWEDEELPADWKEGQCDSVDRETLWKLLRHYGIPSKLVFLIKSNYERMTCRVIHGGQFSRQFRVQAGSGRAVCYPLSPFCWS